MNPTLESNIVLILFMRGVVCNDLYLYDVQDYLEHNYDRDFMDEVAFMQRIAQQWFFAPKKIE